MVPTPSDGEALKDALATGDADAFVRIFDAYATRLRRFAFRYVGSWEETEDVVHDVFAQLWLQRGTLEFVNELEAYLYTATRNQALNVVKRRRTRHRHVAEVSAGAVERVTVANIGEAELMASEATAALQRAVDNLPRRQREVILLRWRQCSYNEIASTLGISPKTVSIHLGRAFETLRQILPKLLG